MATFNFGSYCSKAELNLKGKGNKAPSIEQIWREAMRIAWPEPSFCIKGDEPEADDLAVGEVVTECGPLWITVDGERCLVQSDKGVLVFRRKDVTYDKVDAWLTEKLGEPEELDYTGPKGPRG